MQLLTKFKKILHMEFRATLNFRKFKVALNSMYRIFLNFAKSCILSCLSKFLMISALLKDGYDIRLEVSRIQAMQRIQCEV